MDGTQTKMIQKVPSFDTIRRLIYAPKDGISEVISSDNETQDKIILKINKPVLKLNLPSTSESTRSK